MSLRVAVLSVHTCPLAALGGKETGGMNVYVREVGRELGRMGLTIDVFTRSQDPTIPRVVDLAEGARVIHLPAGPEAPLPRERVYEHIEEFVERVEAWRLTRGLEYDLLHAHYWLSGIAALALRERWDVPVLQMFHTLGRLKNDVARSEIELEPDLRIAEEAQIVAATDRIVAASEDERTHLVRQYGARPSRVVVIPCGVDTTLFRPGNAREARAELRTGASAHRTGASAHRLGGESVLLYVGRLAPIKGLETLLAAVAQLAGDGRPVRLLVVGGDADESPDGHETRLRQLATSLGIGERVAFLGPQPQAALRTYYVAADAAVLPSYYESFGMVALEAMACGTPVIASRVGGLATTVRDGITGFLVPEGDVPALARRIADLTGDEALRTRLGLEGIRWAARHRWACIAEAVCREYARLEPRARAHLGAARCPP